MCRLNSLVNILKNKKSKLAPNYASSAQEDCINRYKFLVERIRKKKEEEQAAAELATKRDGDYEQEIGSNDTDDRSSKAEESDSENDSWK